MSCDYERKGTYVKKELTKRKKIETKMNLPFEFYIAIGSTFSLLPDFTVSICDDYGEIALDFLWIHITFDYRKGF